MGKENNNYINSYVRAQNNHPISFDTEGNLVDQVTGEKGTMILPEFTITGISPKTRTKNYFGLTEEEPLTAEHLKYAALHFVKDRGYDNGMTAFFNSIKNYNNVAKWLNDNSPALLPIGLTIKGVTYLNNNNQK